MAAVKGNNARQVWLLAVLAGLLATASVTQARDPSVGSGPAAGDETPNLDSKEDKELNIRYAETYLRIAEIELQKALESNRKVANTIPAAQVQRLQEVVRLAQDQLRQAIQGNSGDGLAFENAAAQVRVAEEALNKAVAANNRSPGTVPDLEMDRLKLAAELARLQLAKQRTVVAQQQAMARLPEQVQQLQAEVRELREQLAQLTRQSHSVARPTSAPSATDSTQRPAAGNKQPATSKQK